MTIRGRLTLWNSTVLTAALLACGVAVHFITLSKMIGDVDDVLLAEVEGHKDFAHQIETAKSTGGSELGKLLLQLQSELAKRTESDPELSAMNRLPIRIFKTNRVALLGAKDSNTETYDDQSFDVALAGRTDFRSVRWSHGDYRVVSYPVVQSGQVTSIIQSVRPIGSLYGTMHSLDHALLQILPFALLVAIMGGAFLTARSLRPIGKLASAVESIGPDSLSHRLPVENRDELGRLATVFNQMLGRLETSFEAQRRFVADASHELRTPLTALKANTSLALSSEPNIDEFERALRSADAAANGMTKLVNDLLFLSKADSGNGSADLTTVTLNDLLDEVCAEWQHQATQNGIEVIVMGSEPVVATTDGEQLRRVLSNLIANAIRHTATGGAIKLSTNSVADHIEIAVEDNGTGIAQEQLPHLFERFYRVDDARGRADGGFGLGLSICQSLVAGLGGTTKIESQVGRGTTVTIRFPRNL